MFKLIAKIVFSFLVISPLFIQAQSDTSHVSKEKTWWKKGKQYVIVFNDGTEYIGEILADNDKEIQFQTKTMGRIFIPKFQIRSINLLDVGNLKDGELLAENSHRNLYLMGTNAFLFKKGELRITSAYFFLFSAQYSVDKNISAGIQTSFFGAPFGAFVKTSFSVGNKDYIGTEFNIASLSYLGNSGTFGSNSFRSSSSYLGNVCVKYTRGDEKTNFTFMGGVGFSSLLMAKVGYYNSGFVRKEDNTYYFNGSMFHRLSKNIGFAAEGWVVPKHEFGLIGVGIRTLKYPERSWSFGFYNLIYKRTFTTYSYSPTNPPVPTTNRYTEFIPIPYFGVTFKL